MESGCKKLMDWQMAGTAGVTMCGFYRIIPLEEEV